MAPTHPFLRDVYPDLTVELADLLEHRGERELAVGAREIRLVDECDCGIDSCQSIWTAEHPRGEPYGPGHRNVMLDPEEGMLILDVVDERIVHVEILDRSRLRRHAL